MISDDAAGLAEQSSAYDRLIALLDHHGATFRVIDHAPEGRTEIVSEMRGHALAQAAKCIIVLAKRGRKNTHFVLAVVPGDMRVDLGRVKTLVGATYVGFAAQNVAEELGQTASGTILPFAADERLELIVDPALLRQPEMFFNAARLERSIALRTEDYVRIARPRIESIATPAK